jgi:hypothetical protein
MCIYLGLIQSSQLELLTHTLAKALSSLENHVATSGWSISRLRKSFRLPKNTRLEQQGSTIQAY